MSTFKNPPFKKRWNQNYQPLVKLEPNVNQIVKFGSTFSKGGKGGKKEGS